MRLVGSTRSVPGLAVICANCNEEVPEGEFCPECGEPSLLEGRYRLEASVGRGGMGTTYRAVDVDDGGEVAVKELPVRRVDTVKAMELFEREASVLEELDHPGVPDYHDDFSAGEGSDLSLYLVQEFIEGETLEAYLDRHRPTEEEVLETLENVLEIFEYLHGLEPPVIHRDVKPDNIMRRCESGELVLVDFGAVREVVEQSESGGSTVAGTFGYMAPEQFMGRAEPSTDIYGIGATAVSMLAGRHPRELLNHNRELEWRSAVDVGPAVEAVIGEMLESDPGRRPSGAAELAERIRRIRSGESTDVPSTRTSNSPAPVDLPSPPRELPEDFLDDHGTGTKWKLKFGLIFGVIPLPIIVVGAGSAFVLPAADALGTLGVTTLFVLLFGSVGGGIAYSGWRRKATLEDVYRHGRLTQADITRVTHSSYRSNDQSATRIRYRFELDARPYTGYGDTFDVAASKVDREGRIPVLYDPDDPDRNMALMTHIPID